MTSYAFATDSVAQTIEADDIDTAARIFAADNGYDGECMSDLLEFIENAGGRLTVDGMHPDDM
jgi:hypothetical protein